MTKGYSENMLVEQPAVELLAGLGWQTIGAFDEVFGDYVGVCDFKQSMDDGATVPLRREKPLALPSFTLTFGPMIFRENRFAQQRSTHAS